MTKRLQHKFRVGHHSQPSHAGEPCLVHQNAHDIRIELPTLGWDIYVELNDRKEPVIHAYRPEERAEHTDMLVLTNPNRVKKCVR